MIHFEAMQPFDPNGLLFNIEVDHFRDDMTDYFISSPHLEAIEGDNIIQAAQDFGVLVNGVFEIFDIDRALHLRTHRLMRRDPFEIIGNISVWPQGPEFFMPYSALDTNWLAWSRLKGSYIDSETGNFCALCLIDPRIRNIAITFGYLGVNSISLSSAIEHLRFNEKELSDRFDIDLKELKLLKGTANNFTVLGPAVRHGEKGHEPPRKPMTLSQAKAIVFGMVRAEAQLVSQADPFRTTIGELFNL